MKNKRLLVVNPFGIGDAVLTLSLVAALRARCPGAFIGFVCNERTADVVRLSPAIDRTYVFNRGRYRRLWARHPRLMLAKLSALLSLIRRERFDALVDVSLGRQYAFFAMLCGIRERVGLDFKGRGVWLTRKIRIAGYDDAPVARTQLRLLEPLGFGPPLEDARVDLRLPAEIEHEAFELLRRGAAANGPLLAVAPGGGATWGANAHFKQWAPENFAEVARGWCGRVNAPALILGDSGESELLREVAERIGPRALVVCGQRLDLVAALLSRATALLCNDGGLMHLANALNVRTVSIFGPVDERGYGPFGGTAGRAIVTQDVPCRPCYHTFRFPPCPYGKRCLTELRAAKVLTALEEISAK